jgi:outer membrane receptor protein involved in Fe transport
VVFAHPVALRAQTALPEVVVNAPKPSAKRLAPRQLRAAPSHAGRVVPSQTESGVAAQIRNFDQIRDSQILPKTGTRTYSLNHDAIEAMPQGTNASIGKVLLQAPGVHQDSAASGEGPFHIRNEHGNVQYRINGILLPSGVSGFVNILETGFIGNLDLVTGALPAQYGFKTAALVDITSRSGGPEPSGRVSLYGGSRQTITPSFEYGGIVGNTEYFLTGRYFASAEGIENTTPSLNAIHDYTGRLGHFGYSSTVINDTTRVSTITGSLVGKMQIPNTPGQVPQFTAFGVTSFDSSLLNENQWERNYYGVVALQKKLNDADLQLAYFTRYSSVHFVPDPVGDLVFNGIASNVYRSGYLNGIQGDGAYRLNQAHTLRAGMSVSAENSHILNSAIVLPVVDGSPVDAPFNIVDPSAQTGWLIGTYLQDEWRISNQFTLSVGLRFDQMYQYVDANQLSPRVNLIYKPVENTTFHLGYARYFTPPPITLSAPTNLSLFENTTQQPRVPLEGSVLPERAHYFDAGVVQRVLPGLDLGLDAYYKLARDAIDDGQFGQALILTAFNYARAINEGIEVSAKYQNGSFKAYGNLAWSRQLGTQIVSNQYLFDPDQFLYIATHWIYADHSQTWTGSAGLSYLWNDTRFSADMIYGSGLRRGFANTEHVPAYTQVNLGVSRELAVSGAKPITLRFDIVNVFDSIYQIRDGSGIGVFAPQFGPRRGFFVGLSQKL